RDRILDPNAGFNPWLERRLRAVLGACRRNGTRIVTNMGVANPLGAAEAAAAVARGLGLGGVRIAWLEGDDVASLIDRSTPLPEIASTVGEIGRPMVGANAYLGADAILPALDQDAEVVITGRVADPSLFLAPLRHAFGWGEEDWERLGKGTVVGHLLECAAQVTGGYFADPPYKVVPDLARVGFPFAEVAADGSAVLTKLDGTGGAVTERTVKEQILYEVHDPAAYVTPDVIADFSGVSIEEQAPDRIRIGGASGAPRPELLKVTVAFDGGLVAEAEVSYAGPGAADRAKLAGDVVIERMRHVHGLNGPLRVDLIGVGSLHATAHASSADASDVRLRAALRGGSRDEAELLLWEIEALLCCGPAGGGGYRGRVTPSVVTHNAFLPREQIRSRVEVIRA
ncbi:MAG: acyclic terpene utilization AtuA family protein, partial [Geminicoccaceae bacterium]|nr:acyclic terpene utilization AtuA family protein [Geminicoccaceae bacterium]